MNERAKRTVRAALAISEAIEFRDAGKSPLRYDRGGDVRRLVLCDTSVDTPPAKHDQYFAEIERWRRRSRTGKMLKKPKLEEIIPGVDDNCIVAFLDWSKYGPDGLYIHYMKSRGDMRGKGYARRIIEEFYRRHSDAKLIHWGKMMHPAVGKLLHSMQERYPKIQSVGKVYY